MHKVTSSDGAHCGIMKVLLHQALSLCDHSVFANEAISLSRLQHPCLTPVLSCGLNPMNVVWEAAPGCSAMEHMDRCAPPSPSHLRTVSPNARAPPSVSWRAAPTILTKHLPRAWNGELLPHALQCRSRCCRLRDAAIGLSVLHDARVVHGR